MNRTLASTPWLLQSENGRGEKRHQEIRRGRQKQEAREEKETDDPSDRGRTYLPAFCDIFSRTRRWQRPRRARRRGRVRSLSKSKGVAPRSQSGYELCNSPIALRAQALFVSLPPATHTTACDRTFTF